MFSIFPQPWLYPNKSHVKESDFHARKQERDDHSPGHFYLAYSNGYFRDLAYNGYSGCLGELFNGGKFAIPTAGELEILLGRKIRSDVILFLPSYSKKAHEMRTRGFSETVKGYVIDSNGFDEVRGDLGTIVDDFISIDRPKTMLIDIGVNALEMFLGSKGYSYTIIGA